MFEGWGNLGALLKQAQEVGERLRNAQQQLRDQRAQGSAGGGMVEVEVNGLGELLRVRIEPSLVAQGDVEMLEDLIPAAVRQAQEKARQLHAAALHELGAGLQLPGQGPDDLSSLLSPFPAPPADD